MRAALALVALAAALAGCGGNHIYHAEFSDAQGLVSGNDVRVNGAIAGRVESIRLTARGAADVEFTVRSTEAVPRAGAVAAIRPVDLLGDNYLALSPGAAG